MNRVTVHPVYRCRRVSLRHQLFGVFVNGVLSIVTTRYPSHLLRDRA